MAQTPALKTLRETIYSAELVRLIGTIAGVQLNQQMDMSGHRYPPGVRLVGGTRRVRNDAVHSRGLGWRGAVRGRRGERG